MTSYHGNVPENIVIDLTGRLAAQSRILDLGCGIGRNAFPLAEAGHHVEGRDNDVEELRMLEEEAHRRSVRIETVLTDVRNLRIGFGTWHAILAVLILHLLSKEEGAWMHQNIRLNVLPGGYIALVAMTSRGDLPRLFPQKYYPNVTDVLSGYQGWEVITHKVEIVPCKTRDIQAGLNSERLTFLARKPL
jgi:2-polyprenyl-3-methyl-5-hydroxy-6-metoxy-1,4-benzoquinol methylase